MPLTISVIIGSTRPNRFSEKPAHWITTQLKQLPDVDVQLHDLRDWPLPFYDQPSSPSGVQDGNYGNDLVNKWAKVIGASDAFVMVSPEYNHGTSAVLKNALDVVYKEWNNKPVAFVSYGSAGGARAVEQLRLIAIELQMAPIRQAVHIPGSTLFPIIMGKAEWNPDADESLKRSAQSMITQLLWWTKALKAARE